MEQRDNTIAIAGAFTAHLAKYLSEDEWQEMKEKNASPEYKNTGSCASHDYCDANVVMDEAMSLILGRRPNIHDEADQELWNEAWGYASEHFLTDKAEG